MNVASDEHHIQSGPPGDLKAPLGEIPFGWFYLMESKDLKPRDLRLMHRCGQDFILWRGANGEPHFQEAYCPHLGANIGVGGEVIGDTVRCPFHHWSFDGCGAVTSVPYAQRKTARARLDTLPVCERYGNIFAWYHPRRVAPTFELPAIPELDSVEYIGPINRTHLVRAHIQEMVENGVDGAHFTSVHKHPGEAAYEEVKFEGEQMYVRTSQLYPGSKGPVVGSLETLNFGCGVGIVRYHTLIDVCMLVLNVPIDLKSTEITFQVRYRNADRDERMDRIGRTFEAEVNRQLTEDIPIWENKVFKARPVLCDGDGPILRYRRWMSQFYQQSKAPV
jgi:nitrite reductase/ring-hydroxylating ferredoxin subunit